MELKRNYKYFLQILFIFIVTSSCDGFQYQKIKLTGESKKLEIIGNEFVFDSIIIENNDKTFLMRTY